MSSYLQVVSIASNNGLFTWPTGRLGATSEGRSDETLNFRADAGKTSASARFAGVRPAQTWKA